MSLYIKKLHPNAIIPSRQSELAAGYDMCTMEKVSISPLSRQLVSTGIAMTVPEGTYGPLASRSGLSVKNGLHVGAGVIDRDYTGEVKILLINISNDQIDIDENERVAQLIIMKIDIPCIVEVEELTDTIRGSNGFGST
jgi:deoxyuridine 5'-triphosphate nucleotidohydrolase